MKRLIWLPVAGFLLVAGATVAAAAPGLADTAAGLLTNQGSGPTATQDADSEDVRGEAHLAFGGPGLLEDVLANLVTTGVITQEQSDAITAALTTAAEEQRAELEAQSEQMQAMWEQIKTFLEDGVITADEIAQLPADNPFSNLEEILADGQITQEELESVGPFGGHFFDGPDGHRGPGRHFVEDWAKPAPDAGEDSDAQDPATEDPATEDSGANS